jgi:hypothetical protein
VTPSLLANPLAISENGIRCRSVRLSNLDRNHHHATQKLPWGDRCWIGGFVDPPCSCSPAQHPYLKTLGLQLYTLRNQLAEDIPGTIKAVADAGYYQVELMRVVGGEPIFQAARDHGLKVTSAMIDWKTLVSPGEEGTPSFQETLDVAQRQKLEYLVIPYVGRGHRETADQLKTLARRANRAGEACRKAGIQLCYHHHSFEFAKLPSGQTGWDVFVHSSHFLWHAIPIIIAISLVYGATRHELMGPICTVLIGRRSGFWGSSL